MRGTITTVTTGSATSGSYRFGKIGSVSRTAGGGRIVPLEKSLLAGDCGIELRLDGGDAALRLAEIESGSELGRKQLVRQVERHHHRDALGAGHLAGLAHIVHLAVEVGHRLPQRLALAVFAGDLVAAAEDADFERFGAGRHADFQSGRRAMSCSSRALAGSMRALRRRLSCLAGGG